MQHFFIFVTFISILLLMPVSAKAELQYFIGYLDVVKTSGKACKGIQGRQNISMVISNNEDQEFYTGYFGGEGAVTVGQLSGSSQAALKVRYPYADSTRAEGHTLKLSTSGTSLSGELHDRHIDVSVDDCNFDFARLTLKRSENAESANEAYLRMSSLYDAQLARSTAILLTRKGAHAEAAPFYGRALSSADRAFKQQSPKLNPYLTGLANSYMRLGRFSDFNLLYLERYAGLDDEAVRALFNGFRIRSLLHLGRLALGREEYSDALDKFKLAFQLNTKNKDAISAIMSALVRSGRHEEAISFLEQTEKNLDSEPDRRDVRGAIALVQYQKAKLDEKSGRIAEAETALGKAIQLDPDTFQYLVLQARWRHKAGNYIEADTILKNALERFKDEAARSEIAAARDKLHKTEMILTKIRRAGY